jgi:hypothetical protein
MKPVIFSVCGLVGALLASGCDAQGVSVGSEELCVADANLRAAEANSVEEISACARIRENRLPNGDFETPRNSCGSETFCAVPATLVDGWRTSSADQVIEVWLEGHHGVPAYQGKQFVELDANSPDTLWQDLALAPGQLMFWSFEHRGRLGPETVELQIGPPEAGASQGSYTSPIDAWYRYSGLYRVGPDETETRFSLISRTGTTQGNLVDAVVFAPVD